MLLQNLARSCAVRSFNLCLSNQFPAINTNPQLGTLNYCQHILAQFPILFNRWTLTQNQEVNELFEMLATRHHSEILPLLWLDLDNRLFRCLFLFLLQILRLLFHLLLLSLCRFDCWGHRGSHRWISEELMLI